jgi:hypothetical protein
MARWKLPAIGASASLPCAASENLDRIAGTELDTGMARPALHHSNFYFETVDRDALLGRGSRVGSKAGRAGAVTLAASALALVMMASAKLS